jgi:hypothetical protein
VPSPSEGIGPGDIYVLATDENGETRVAKARKTARPDVSAYFKHPEIGEAGFSILLKSPDSAKIMGLRLAAFHNGAFHLCPTVWRAEPQTGKGG